MAIEIMSFPIQNGGSFQFVILARLPEAKWNFAGISMGFNNVVIHHRCPFPIGWLINRGVCLPLDQQVNDSRWYTKRPLYFYQKDIIVLRCFEHKNGA